MAPHLLTREAMVLTVASRTPPCNAIPLLTLLCPKRLPHGSFSALGTAHIRACTQVVPLTWMLLPQRATTFACHFLQVFDVKPPLGTLSKMSCLISITLFFLTSYHLPIGSSLYLTNLYSLFLCRQLSCTRQDFLFCIVSS